MLEFRGLSSLSFYLSWLSLICSIHCLAGELTCRLERERLSSEKPLISRKHYTKRMWAVHQLILEELTCSVAHAFGGAAGVVYPAVAIGVVSFWDQSTVQFFQQIQRYWKKWKKSKVLEGTGRNWNRFKSFKLPQKLQKRRSSSCGSTVRVGYAEFAPEPTAVRMSRYSPAQSNMLTCLIPWYPEEWGNCSCM